MLVEAQLLDAVLGGHSSFVTHVDVVATLGNLRIPDDIARRPI